MTKIYIDQNLTPCALERGWPEDPFKHGIPVGAEIAFNRDILAQAIKDSVPFESQETTLPVIHKYLESIGEKLPMEWQAVMEKFNLLGKPDSFIDVDVEFEFSEREVLGRYMKFARVKSKPVSEKPRCEIELFVERYFGITGCIKEADVIPGADYGQIVNLLAMYREELDKLKK